jgi:hypothetical protein
MATALALPPESLVQSESAPARPRPTHQGPTVPWHPIPATVPSLREVESGREVTLREREVTWACEWWPPDEQGGTRA